jgi:hypothetical protein
VFQIEISPGIPNILSGDVSLVDFDFQQSNMSPLGFAEAAFAIPDQPSTISNDADQTLQQQLNAYLAWETAIRSVVSMSHLCCMLWPIMVRRIRPTAYY